tara:strand:- start:264 stop:458 length:195 start_codon:yes stop_codon:yes gene_type:complete
MSSINNLIFIKDDKIFDLKNDGNKDLNNKTLPEKIEGKIDKVFINMKKRGSYTNFKIDYPWLTF